MDDIKITLPINNFKEQIDPSKLDGVIYVEDSDELHTVSQIDICGDHERSYKVVTDFLTLHDRRVLIHGDLLIVCLFARLIVYDMKNEKLIRDIETSYDIFRCIRFGDGFFIHGEVICYYLDDNFETVWEAGCCDIFVYPDIADNLEIGDDYIAVIDWDGDKHYYNTDGEYRCVSVAPKKE